MADQADPIPTRGPAPRQLRGRAVLFDMDGTLVDSTAVVERIWAAFAAEYRVGLDELLAYAHGRQTLDTLRRFLPPGADADAVAAGLESVEHDDVAGIVEIAGARQLLAQLRGAPTAVVTSAPRELAVRRMRTAGLPEPSVLVAAEDVSRGKPHPDGYLLAADRLDVRAAECVVLEDAGPGIDAGLAAGARVLVVGAAATGQRDLPRAANLLDVRATVRDGWITLVLGGGSRPHRGDGLAHGHRSGDELQHLP
jgi:sugar-phosphatase